MSKMNPIERRLRMAIILEMDNLNVHNIPVHLDIGIAQLFMYINAFLVLGEDEGADVDEMSWIGFEVDSAVQSMDLLARLEPLWFAFEEYLKFKTCTLGYGAAAA